MLRFRSDPAGKPLISSNSVFGVTALILLASGLISFTLPSEGSRITA
jgi:hypothetical protein